MDCLAHVVNLQVESEQRPHKVSFYVDKKEAEHVLATLTERFRVRGVRSLTPGAEAFVAFVQI